MPKPVSAKAQAEIALYTNSMVATYFAMMHNPTSRGEAFTWEGFPAWMEEHARTKVLIHTKFHKPEHVEMAAKFSRKEAERLIKLMTE